MDKIADIKSRHEVSAPFQGEPEGSKASYNQAREDRGVLLDEILGLRIALDLCVDKGSYDMLREAAEEALNFLTSPANVTQQQRITNAIAELADALKK